jgi:hypothetical protein
MNRIKPQNINRTLTAATLGLTFLLMGTVSQAQYSSKPGTRPMVSGPIQRAPWNRKNMPVGSYLTTPARTVEELQAQLDNPVVMERYRKAFKIDDARIKEMLSGLHLARLEHDFYTDVWYVHHDDGTVGYRRRLVRKGNYVFVDKNNRVVLAQVCGNPVQVQPPIRGENNPLTQPQKTSSIQEFLEDEPLPKRPTAVLNVAMFDMSPMRTIAPAVSNITVASLPTPLLTRFFAGITPITPPIVPPVVPPVGGIPFIPPILPPIIPGDTPPEIPEPGLIALSLSALGSGVALRGAAWRRRRRA